jgi:hypothetical protein
MATGSYRMTAVRERNGEQRPVLVLAAAVNEGEDRELGRGSMVGMPR